MENLKVTSGEKFRIRHSTLVEHYQFIEFHLKGIYASLCDKGFFAGTKDVKTDTFHHLISKIKSIESEKKISLLSNSDYERLEYMCERRNFWCHNCYIDLIFDRRTAAPKDIKPLIDDLFEAEEMREKLYQLKMRIMR